MDSKTECKNKSSQTNTITLQTEKLCGPAEPQHGLKSGPRLPRSLWTDVRRICQLPTLNIAIWTRFESVTVLFTEWKFCLLELRALRTILWCCTAEISWTLRNVCPMRVSLWHAAPQPKNALDFHVPPRRLKLPAWNELSRHQIKVLYWVTHYSRPAAKASGQISSTLWKLKPSDCVQAANACCQAEMGYLLDNTH